MTGYGLPGDAFVVRAPGAAQAALATGLAALNSSIQRVVSSTVRSDNNLPRTRSRPSGNEAPIRHQPGANARPIPGRLGVPVRQPTPGEVPDSTGAEDTTQVIRPVGDTQLIDRVAEAPPGAGSRTSASRNAPPGGYPSRPDPTDAAAEVWALVERAQRGEAEAFGLIYDRYVDTVFRFIYFRVGNRQLAEDLTSDTFLRALKRIGSFTWQGRDLGAWLVTIARNLVADHFKSGRYRLEVTTGDVLDADREDRGPEGSPEAAVVDHITNVALLTAVKQLNPEQQECIVLRFLQGFSVAETAQAMGKNEGAIKALQYRAVRALGRLLPEGFQP